MRAAAAAAIAARARFRLGLPGGRTPEPLLRALGIEPVASAIAWERVQVLMADERAVPPGDPARNDRRVRTALEASLGARAPRVVPMPAAEVDLEAAAIACEALYAEPLDLLVLGVGEDGHVASLFPGSPQLRERERRVAAVHDAPRPPARRLTLTPRAIAEARRVLVLATGAEKSRAVAGALAVQGPVEDIPARLVRAREWIVDVNAARGL